MIARLKSLVATSAGNATLVLATALLSAATMVFAAIRWPAAVEATLRLWARLVLGASGVRLDCPAADRWPELDRCILMANHSSLFDIPVLLLATPWRIRFMAKRQLFSIPLLGWALHSAGFVPVDRGRRRSGARAFRSARDVLDRGFTLAIFPEETRTSDGQLLPFRAGGALLAMATEAPVVPVAILGALTVRRRDSWIIRPGTISVHYARPLLPGDFHDRKQLNDAIRQQIAQMIEAGQAEHEP